MEGEFVESGELQRRGDDETSSPGVLLLSDHRIRLRASSFDRRQRN